MAEDAVQDACAAALAQWPVDGLPPNPGGWLVSVARHKLVDRLRRETRRGEKEAAAVRGTLETDPEPGGADLAGDDELSLIFLCCHPALDPAVQVALTLRSVCGLTTAEIAAAFLVSEPTMAKRLVRAKDKIRKTGISFKVPSADALAERIAGVLRVVYLVFTEGHQATGGNLAVRADLCESALRLARALTGLLPGEPEAEGLLALILLTDARRPARTD
ncbi:MAG: polymerase subunit sigma-24, partial [Acidimicrobiaceae bacterium]|nr:polymerase subunit sigma-24 [Acidimicrobiaceae bacterium]